MNTEKRNEKRPVAGNAAGEGCRRQGGSGRGMGYGRGAGNGRGRGAMGDTDPRPGKGMGLGPCGKKRKNNELNQD